MIDNFLSFLSFDTSFKFMYSSIASVHLNFKQVPLCNEVKTICQFILTSKSKFTLKIESKFY